MKKCLKYSLSLIICYVGALSDKVAVVVNDHVITQQEVVNYVTSFSIITSNTDKESDVGFQQYVINQMVVNYLLVDFADMHQLDLTPEEETAAISQVMTSNGRKVEDFDTYAKELGIESQWLRSFILSNVLQQKVGMAIIAPSISVAEEDVVLAKQKFTDENTEYKIKAWTIGHDESNANIDVIKTLKSEWASSGQDPSSGEVQDLGWRRRIELPTLFLKALEGVNPGNLIGPIQSEYGYHLVWFEGENIPSAPSEKEIRGALEQEQYIKSYNEWLTNLPSYNVVVYK